MENPLKSGVVSGACLTACFIIGYITTLLNTVPHYEFITFVCGVASIVCGVAGVICGAIALMIWLDLDEGEPRD